MQTELASPRRRWRWIGLIWLAVPLLLWWALRTIPLADIWATLSRLGPLQLLALIGVNALVLFTLSGRSWLILRAQGYRLPYLALATYRLAAFGVSYFTPGPHFGGEPLQVYLVRRRHGVPSPAAVAAVALDKLLEVLVNSTFLVAGVICVLQWRIFPGTVGIETAAFALVLLALPLGFLITIWGGWRPLAWLRRRLPRRVAQRVAQNTLYQTAAASEIQAAELCRQHPVTLVHAVLLSLLTWAGILAEYWLTMHFLGLRTTPIQLISILTAARIAYLTPLPGGLGALEASQVLALRALGLNPAVGLGLTLIVRARDVLLAGLGLWWGGLAISGRVKVGRAHDSTGGDA
jgi:uncharacterized protein (TIRG00374 family)